MNNAKNEAERSEDVAKKNKAEKMDDLVRGALIEQLKARKADTPFFLETVNEVIYMRQQLRELKKLVAAGGIVKVGEDRRGNLRVSINDALREIRDTEKTILTMLKEMKITTDNIISDDADAEL